MASPLLPDQSLHAERDDHFETDEAALTEVKKTILAEGIGSLIGSESGSVE